MGDGDDGHRPGHAFQVGKDARFGAVIDRAGRFVEDQQAGAAQDHRGKEQPLAFTAG